jgi:hypothetical protein
VGIRVEKLTGLRAAPTRRCHVVSRTVALAHFSMASRLYALPVATSDSDLAAFSVNEMDDVAVIQYFLICERLGRASCP